MSFKYLDPRLRQKNITPLSFITWLYQFAVPGDGGSQIEAKLNKTETVHYFCEAKTTDFFTLWIAISDLVPYAVDCFTDNMRLVYDNVTRKTSNSPGVDIRIPGFGTTDTIEYLDPSHYGVTGYFNILVEGLLKMGYNRSFTLLGAPYDFRKSPLELGDFLTNLTQLIEGSYRHSNGVPSVIVCHSMGCPLMLYLLTKHPQEWKDKYIKSMITLAAPWGGAVKAMKAFASGDNLGVIVIPELKVRKDERTFPSMAFLLPRPSFWDENETIIRHVGGKNYSISNFKEFFHDLDFDVGYEMWLDTKDLMSDLPAPNVEVHCLYGSGINTMEYLEYKEKDFPDHGAKIRFGEGDGTVNLRSLEGCLRWIDKQKQPVHHHNFKGVDHMSIMADMKVLDYIKKIVHPGTNQSHYLRFMTANRVVSSTTRKSKRVSD
ncbi:lysosomal phospholipase A and acyltransferase-like isoform X2 [Brevipalpus obovatus]|uniref:lysosomal phospholipase A and acyltransferase-like isoform X2 n=1 Tax=Brevipalpus obovatus TaxID=246614 RepID=UPI003D9DF42D